LTSDDEFRISVAGAQEKTALLWHDGQWIKPHGATPTTHLIKTQIGKLPGGIDLSDSVENEYYCLKLTAAFGLPVNNATIETFGETKALVIERFDRRWTGLTINLSDSKVQVSQTYSYGARTLSVSSDLWYFRRSGATWVGDIAISNRTLRHVCKN
jgi:serine/threonine protein kinase HipA of HipAB toxin-antitoxin module